MGTRIEIDAPRRGEVAVALPGRSSRWASRRAPSGRTAHHGDDDVEAVIVKTLKRLPRRHPLVDEVDGQGDRDEPVGGLPDLAGIRASSPT